MYIEAVYNKANFGQNYCQIYGGNISLFPRTLGHAPKCCLVKMQ